MKRRKRMFVKKNLQLKFCFVAFVMMMASSLVIWFLMNMIFNHLAGEISSGSSEWMSLLHQSNWVVAAVVLGNSLAVFLLFSYFTNQVAGPIYRIEKTLLDLIQKKHPRPIVLRKNDLLHDTADLVNQLIK